MSTLGFETDFIENGRPGYHPKVLLKLYSYGYMNRIRSSRQLERECKRNIELMWLLESLSPDHNTISNFRKDNAKAIKRTFHATVKIARNFGLTGAQLIAGDGTKMRAQNSKKNNYNLKKVARHIEYIDNKLQQYNQELEQTEEPERQTEIAQQLKKQQQRKSNYTKIETPLKESGEPQISTSDPDSKHMIVRNNITEVAYNIQSTVDAEHCIPIDYDVTNVNDKKAMGNMLRSAKAILRNNDFTALFDKGYHTGSELRTANELDIDTLVAVPGIGRSSQAPDPNYNSEHFYYNTTDDTYTCPQGHILSSNGTWYKNIITGSNSIRQKNVRTVQSVTCAPHQK
jgi:transposase